MIKVKDVLQYKSGSQYQIVRLAGPCSCKGLVWTAYNGYNVVLRPLKDPNKEFYYCTCSINQDIEGKRCYVINNRIRLK